MKNKRVCVGAFSGDKLGGIIHHMCVNPDCRRENS